MKSDGFERLTDVCAALADPTRLRILALLASEDDVCVCHLYESLELPQSKTSRHLAYLRRAGLVHADKRGLWVYYRLVVPHDEPTRAILAAVRQTATSMRLARQDAARLNQRKCCQPDRPAPRAAGRPARVRTRMPTRPHKP